MKCVELMVGEGLLDARAGLRLLQSLNVPIDPARCINKGGSGAFWRDAPKYDAMARNDGIVLALTDLDQAPWPSGLISDRLGRAPSARFLLRIAARKVESWFIADAGNLARYLGVSAHRVPRDPDSLPDPKRTLVNLARQSRRRPVREDVVPEPGPSAPVGKNYVRVMEEFVEQHWDPLVARKNSRSLARAIKAIQSIAA